MKNLDLIAEELFNKIRGRFPSVTLGNGEGKVTNKPNESRFYDFDYVEGDRRLGKVSISLSDDAVEVMYSNDFVANEDVITKENWYDFLKELRQFSKKRMLKFDTRNINKSNLDQRDYKFLATNRTGDDTMNESKMYGTNKTSYQNVGEAKIAIKHSKPINTESATGRIQNIGAIFIESPEGERFKYPYKHLNGARAMARHVAEGGKPFDDFGKHITGLSEELNSLKKFKSYVNRSSVMAEGLSGYMLPVNERLDNIKKTITSLQKQSTYRTAFENFEQPVFEDMPEDVAENWIDQLTIKQFNEELKDVFPFVYRLVSETTKAKIVSADDLLGEAPVDDVEVGLPAETYKVQQGDTLYSIYMKFRYSNFQDHDRDTALQAIMDENPDIEDPSMIQPGMIINMPYFMGSGPSGSTRGLPPGGFEKYESELEGAFEEMMGQFSSLEEGTGCSCNDGGNCTCPTDCKDCNCNESTDESNMDVEEEKIPVTEFILSLYDRATGQFPKGETAVLTAVEKDYGEQYIDPAKAFIEAVNAKFEEFNGYKDPELMDDEKKNLDSLIKTGVSGSYDFIAKTIKDFEELIRNNPNHPKVPQVKAELAKLKPQLAQARKDSGMGESEVEENFLSRMIGAQGVKPDDFVEKAMKISQRYENLAFKNKIASDPNRPFNGKQGGAFLIELYMELINMSREIQKYGGGNKTMKNAQQQMSLIKQAMAGPVDNPEAARLMKAARVEPKFIIDFVKQDIQSMGESEVEESGLQYYTGKKKYGKEGMAALAQAGRDGASEEELGRVKDKYKKESEDLRKLAGL